MKKKGLGLRGEDDAVRQRGVPEGFLAETVAGEEELTDRGVVQGEGEHAAEVVEHLPVVPPVEVKKHLRVTGGEETIPERGQFLAKVAEVVDLSVEGDREAPVGRDHRLVGAGGIDDGEALESDCAPAVRGEEAARLVRSAVPEP
jgi:hypothetical protein